MKFTVVDFKIYTSFWHPIIIIFYLFIPIYFPLLNNSFLILMEFSFFHSIPALADRLCPAEGQKQNLQ